MEEIYKKYNFPSVAKFKQILKLNDVKATNKEIEEFIKNKNVNQLHKPVITYKRNLKFITALEPFEMLQIDLLDYQKYSKTNKGFKFILIGIDIFTRFGYAEPIKDKTPSNVFEAFKNFDIKN